MPKLDAELSANYRDEIDGSSAENTSYKAMLVMSFDLYNGGINQARVKEAQARAEEAQFHQEAAGRACGDCGAPPGIWPFFVSKRMAASPLS